MFKYVIKIYQCQVIVEDYFNKQYINEDWQFKYCFCQQLCYDFVYGQIDSNQGDSFDQYQRGDYMVYIWFFKGCWYGLIVRYFIWCGGVFYQIMCYWVVN